MSCVNPPARPAWLTARVRLGEDLSYTEAVLADLKLNTVCLSAACPNLGECYARRTATFLILGRFCTRRCRFCAVPKGEPEPLDPSEPSRVAEAARRLGLSAVVVTSVTRDDLPDGGAGHFAATVAAVRAALPEAAVEILTPDFRGDREAFKIAVGSRPDVFNHNVETVPRLYRTVRPGADYARSLKVLRLAKSLVPGLITKSGLMLGLGEEPEEVREVMADLRATGCDFLTLGQYLAPSPGHLPVKQYIEPGTFARLAEDGRRLGFRHVAAGPFVRSSFRAGEALAACQLAVAPAGRACQEAAPGR